MGEGTQDCRRQLGLTQKAQASSPLLLPLPVPDRVWHSLRVERVQRVPTASRDLSASDVAGPTFVGVLSSVWGGVCPGSTGLGSPWVPSLPWTGTSTCSELLSCPSLQPHIKDTPPALHLGSLVPFPTPPFPCFSSLGIKQKQPWAKYNFI